MFHKSYVSRVAPYILLYERDPGLRKSITLTLKHQGVEVRVARDEADVRQILENESPDLFVVDHDSSIGNSGELIEMFRMKSKSAHRAVLVTATQRVNDNWRKQYQPDMVLYKPFDIRFLYRRIKALL
jgi:DNA-binding response OmpR family regulator